MSDTFKMRMAALSRLGWVCAIFGATLTLAAFHASVVGNYELFQTSRMWWLAAYSGSCVAVAYSFGLPNSSSLATPLRTSLLAASVPPGLFAVLQTSIGEFVLPRFVLVWSVPVNAALFSVFLLWARSFERSRALKEKILLVCSQQDSVVIKRDIEFRTERPCSIARVMALEDGFEMDTFKSISEDVRPTMVVYSVEASENNELIQFLREVHASGVRVRDVATFYDSFVGKVPLRELESSALLFDVGEVHHPSYFRISRGFDVIVGLVGLVALALVIPLILIGNLFGNRGPVLYDQQRIGKGGAPFRIYKLRSMMPGGTSTDWTTTDDPRITRFGRLLRRTHLDELPQVYNILKGDLSLIGPRPEQPRYVEALSESIPFYGSRHLVRPGLTGWAQVNYPYGADEIDAYEKLQYDFWYLKHQRVLIDLKIIARTVRHVLGFRGR